MIRLNSMSGGEEVLPAVHHGEDGYFHLDEDVNLSSSIGSLFCHLLHKNYGRKYNPGEIFVTKDPNMKAGDKLLLGWSGVDPVLKKMNGNILAIVFLPQDGV